jgi:hypothetical protein
MRKRKQGAGGGGEKGEEKTAAAQTTAAEPARGRPQSENKKEEDGEEVELVEVPSDHWLIKRKWRIVKRKKGEDGNKGEEEEENEDTEYEYEVDKRKALIFFVTRLVAVLLVFLFLHTLFHHYVWDPLTRTRETPMEEQIRKFKALGQL